MQIRNVAVNFSEDELVGGEANRRLAKSRKSEKGEKVFEHEPRHKCMVTIQ